jgi:hypothetical protein
MLHDFSSPILLDASVAGGKGANLAKLTQGGFPVPPGFVLPPEAYRAFLMNEPGFAELVRALPVGNTADLEQACQALCARMSHWPVPDTLRGEIEVALARLGGIALFRYAVPLQQKTWAARHLPGSMIPTSIVLESTISSPGYAIAGYRCGARVPSVIGCKPVSGCWIRPWPW